MSLKLNSQAILDISFAVQLIASRCDGAFSYDHEGFNRDDTDAGHNYAEYKEDDWTYGELRNCYWMLKKYHRQLEEEEISWSDIMAPWGNTANEREERAEKREIRQSREKREKRELARFEKNLFHSFY